MTLVIIKCLKNVKVICFILFGMCLFSACHRPTSTKYEINKIEIATSGCLRGCPVIGEIIDSSLAFKYYGGYKAKYQGYYEGKVTQGFWDTLNLKLKRFDFKKLDTSAELPLDGESAEVIFYWGKNKRHIFKSIDDAPPDSVSHLLIGILNKYRLVELHKLKSPVIFETTYQFMAPPSPPKPKRDNVKFHPPK